MCSDRAIADAMRAGMRAGPVGEPVLLDQCEGLKRSSFLRFGNAADISISALHVCRGHAALLDGGAGRGNRTHLVTLEG